MQSVSYSGKTSIKASGFNSTQLSIGERWALFGLLICCQNGPKFNAAYKQLTSPVGKCQPYGGVWKLTQHYTKEEFESGFLEDYMTDEEKELVCQIVDEELNVSICLSEAERYVDACKRITERLEALNIYAD